MSHPHVSSDYCNPQTPPHHVGFMVVFELVFCTKEGRSRVACAAASTVQGGFWKISQICRHDSSCIDQAWSQLCILSPNPHILGWISCLFWLGRADEQLFLEALPRSGLQLSGQSLSCCGPGKDSSLIPTISQEDHLLNIHF